jgi:hypothetical protein
VIKSVLLATLFTQLYICIYIDIQRETNPVDKDSTGVDITIALYSTLSAVQAESRFLQHSH